MTAAFLQNALSPINQVAAKKQYSFPQVAPALSKGEHGIASLTHGGRTLRFRTNPNEFNWTYTLNKKIDPTYGGRVVQLLSTKIDDFSIKADCGGGRWKYMNTVAQFMRDVMVDQRNGRPATFEYTTRGWKLNVYVVSVPFSDAVEEVARPFEIAMKVQEDVSGVMSKNSLDAELRRLQDGVGFRRSKYNDPRLNGQIGNQEQGPLAQIGDAVSQISGAVGDVAGYVSNPFLPGTAVNFSGPNTGGLPGFGGFSSLGSGLTGGSGLGGFLGGLGGFI